MIAADPFCANRQLLAIGGIRENSFGKERSRNIIENKGSPWKPLQGEKE